MSLEMEGLFGRLLAAINDDDLETVENILKRQSGLANTVYPTGHGAASPLIEACSKGRLGATKLLLTYGADIRNRELIISWGQNLIDIFPLIVATREGHLSVVEELLRAGALVNQTNALEQSALHACCIYHSGSENYPTHNEYLLKLITTLIEHGASVNLQDHEGKTPLHYACDPYKECFVKILLANGAYFTLRDNDGNSALDIAACDGCPKDSMVFPTESEYDRISSCHFPMLCMQYATSGRLEDEAVISLLKMCEFSLKEIIDSYETTALLDSKKAFVLMRKATIMRTAHNIPKTILKPVGCHGFPKEWKTLEELKTAMQMAHNIPKKVVVEWETLDELEAFKDNPEQLKRQAGLARDRIREQRKLNPCHLLLPEILKVISTEHNFCLDKSVTNYLELFGLNANTYLNRSLSHNFELLETDSVPEFIKVVMTSGQKIQKQLEIDTKLHDTLQLSLKLVKILGIAVSLIVQLLKGNRQLENGTIEKCLVKQLLKELWEKFPEVQFPKFSDGAPLSQCASKYMEQFQQLLQPRFCVSLPLPYVILCHGFKNVIDCGPLYTEIDFELQHMFIQLGFDINTTDGEGNTLLHCVVSSVLENINTHSGHVRPGNVRRGNVRPGNVQPSTIQTGNVCTFTENWLICTKKIVILLLKGGAYLHAKNKLRKSALDLLQDYMESSNACTLEQLIHIMVRNSLFPSLQHLAAITVRNSNLPYETLLPKSLAEFVDIH